MREQVHIAEPGLPPLVSLVVPVFDEEEAAPLFMAEAGRMIARCNVRFEIVFVDDGSTDATVEAIRCSPAVCPVSVVRLTRNFGKESALTAGLSHARGDAVVPIDVDLQDPLEVVETFVARWQEGYDVVYGVRRDRSSDTRLKRFTSSLFYRLFNALSNEPIPDNVGDFRLMDRRVVDAVLSLPERSRFMKGIFAWVGFRSCPVPYTRAERPAGLTKWNYWKLWNFALDGLTSFSSMPLKIWTYIGFSIAFVSFLYGTTVVLRKLLFQIEIQGWASLMVAVVFFGGVQLITLGVLGEYLGRVFVESKNRPIFLVDSVVEVDAVRSPASPAAPAARRPARRVPEAVS